MMDDWSEAGASSTAHTMGVAVGVNKAAGHFGHTSHNGVALCGTTSGYRFNGAQASKEALEWQA